MDIDVLAITEGAGAQVENFEGRGSTQKKGKNTQTF